MLKTLLVMGRVLAYIHSHIVSRELPRVKVEPIIRNLNLIPVDDFLLEYSISVPQTIAPGGEAQGRQAVEEASRETTKTAVSESRIMLLLNDILDPEPKVRKSSCSVSVGLHLVFYR